MIVVTGGAGFIGSAFIWKLNELGHGDIVVADRLGTAHKWKNLNNRMFRAVLYKDDLLDWLKRGDHQVSAIVHMGASSSTTEADVDYLMRNNVHASMALFRHCSEKGIPFIYASSAATYGDGESGFDDAKGIDDLRPLNPYGFSKQIFDRWVLCQSKTPPFWAGLKFFNVYGPNEYHKGFQSSVVHQFLPQARDEGVIRLFESEREDVAHGEQRRDFVYVKDVVEVMARFLTGWKEMRSGLYNVGTGTARTYVDLAKAVFAALGKAPQIEWRPMPEKLRGQYQYFTQATMERTFAETKFNNEQVTSLEEGVRDYVCNYLMARDPYL